MAKKRKQQGHYCRICGEYKANEKFSGKGHVRHICKECQSLPDDVKADMVRCNEVERAAFKYPMTRQDWELLEKYAKKYKDKESGQFAQDMLDMKRGNHTSEEDMEEDGFEIKTYSASLVVMETERLLIRRITRKDMNALLAIMGKPEVMYAWEHGFTKKDVRKWINRQLTRYRKDGFGYFAVILKESGALIGQAGLMNSTLNGNETVELGYILDNTYWHNGYGTEAARACLEYAFGELELKTVCCSIRPENVASIRVAERLGMTLCGNHTIIYNEKEMPHLIYELKTEN